MFKIIKKRYKYEKYKYILALVLLLPQVVFAVDKASCGEVGHGGISGIPTKIPELTSFIIIVMQVATAVILIIVGSIDLFKGLTSGKEDEMKKGQQTFVKRLIVGVLVFFIVLIVKLLVGAIANASTGNIISCIDCFINNDCNIYEKEETEEDDSIYKARNNKSAKEQTRQDTINTIDNKSKTATKKSDSKSKTTDSKSD